MLRDGKHSTISAEQLVIGDIIEVKAGDRLPADIRVIQASGFKVHVHVCTLEEREKGKDL